MIIDEIQLKVEELVDTIPVDAVIERVMDKARSSHVATANTTVGKGGPHDCDCHYCQTLRMYVSHKLVMHRMKRRLYHDDGYSVDQLPHVEERVLWMQEAICQQRKVAKAAAKF